MGKPKEGFLKLNFDGAKTISDYVGADFVIRDENGRVVASDARRCGTASVLQAEAFGLQLGILEANNLGIRRLEVEGDCLTVVNAIKGVWNNPWEIEILVSDALFLLQSFEEVTSSHTFREDNLVADRMTHLGLESVSPGMRSHIEFESLVCKHALGWWYNMG